MKRLGKGSKLLLASLVICSYFLALYLVETLKVDYFLVGFFGELFTIPFLLAQIILLVLGTYLLLTQRTERNLIMLSVVILSICSYLTIGAIFQ